MLSWSDIRKHLAGGHDQQSHGNRGVGSTAVLDKPREQFPAQDTLAGRMPVTGELNVHPPFAKETAVTLANLMDQYPGVEVNALVFAELDSDTMAVFNRPTKTISVNSKFLQPPESYDDGDRPHGIEREYAESVKVRFHPPTDRSGLETVITHEFGHALNEHMISNWRARNAHLYTDKDSAQRAAWENDFKSLIMGSSLAEHVKFPSSYAGVNVWEGFAEGFVEYKTSNKPREFAMRVGRWVDDWFKTKWTVTKSTDWLPFIKQTRHRKPYNLREWRRNAAAAVQGAKCAVCGSTRDLTGDHKTPGSAGGGPSPSNIRVLCRSCNGREGAQRQHGVRKHKTGHNELDHGKRGGALTDRAVEMFGTTDDYAEATFILPDGQMLRSMKGEGYFASHSRAQHLQQVRKLLPEEPGIPLYEFLRREGWVRISLRGQEGNAEFRSPPTPEQSRVLLEAPGEWFVEYADPRGAAHSAATRLPEHASDLERHGAFRTLFPVRKHAVHNQLDHGRRGVGSISDRLREVSDVAELPEDIAWVLPDGTELAKRGDLRSGTTSVLEHRSIAEHIGSSLSEVVNSGVMRVNFSRGTLSVDFGPPPTPAQRRALVRVLGNADVNTAYIESLSTSDGRTVEIPRPGTLMQAIDTLTREKFAKHAVHNQLDHGNRVSTSLPELASREAYLAAGGIDDRNPDAAADIIDALPDDAYLWVFHATSIKYQDPWIGAPEGHGTGADVIATHGVQMSNVPQNLARQRYAAGESAEYAPGAGVGQGMYVSGTAYGASQYGQHVFAMRVRKSDLAVPPESNVPSQSVGAALVDHNGALLVKDVHVDQIVRLPERRTDQGHRTYQGDSYEMIMNALRVQKHQGPGPHPGTMSPQSVHGGGIGAARAYEELANTSAGALEAEAASGMYLASKTSKAMQTALRKSYHNVADDLGMHDTDSDTHATVAPPEPGEVLRVLIRNSLEAYDYAVMTGLEQEGLQWYTEAHNVAQQLATDHGLSIDQTAAILARFSPMQKWGPNKEAATRFIQAMDYAKKNDLSLTLSPDQIAEALRLTARWDVKTGDFIEFQEGVDPDRVLRMLATPNLKPAQMSAEDLAYIVKFLPTGHGTTARGYMLDGLRDSINLFRGTITPDAVLQSHKIRSFHNNIADPQNSPHLTIDRHQARIAARMYGLEDGPTAKMVNGNKYRIYAEATRIAARLRGVRPNAFQAITWTWYERYWGGLSAHEGPRPGAYGE